MRSDRDGVTLRVRVQPRAARDECAGEQDGILRIRLTAPPVEGEANRALVSFLSALLEIPRKRIVIESGTRSRDKRVHLVGLSVDDVAARLGLR